MQAAATEEMQMINSTTRSWRRASAVTVFAAVAGFTFTAQAGECPADKRKANARAPVNMSAVGVTDTTLGSIDLGKEAVKLKDRELRFRKMTIEPGGVVPWHSHADRPALIYVAEGEILEFASNCAGPILHKAGDVARETSAVSHWWKNLGDKTVILFIGDIRHDKHDKHM
jgi:quercetin dioxygenase-like cupin family protein